SVLIGGLSNRLFKVEVKTNNNKIEYGVIRLFNPRTPLNIEALQETYELYDKSNIGTKILGRISNIGQIEQYINGYQLQDNDLLNNEKIYKLAAISLSKIHNEFKPKLFNNKKSCLNARIYKMINTLNTIITNNNNNNCNNN